MAQRNNVHDKPIILYSDIDVLRNRELIDGGTLVIGGLGSGKSSGQVEALAQAFLRVGPGYDGEEQANGAA
jgi:hypothetical protein